MRPAGGSIGGRAKSRRAPSARTSVRKLEEIRNRFSPETREEKGALLDLLRDSVILDPRVLLRYHEALLFLRAYPDDPGILARVRAECARFATRVELLRRRTPRAAKRLDDSGIAGTTTTYAYDLVTAERLLAWFGPALDIDWDFFEEREALDTLLPLVASWMENDGLDLAEVSTDDWVSAAKGRSEKPALRWLAESIRSMHAAPPVQRHLFDSMEIPIRWRLGDSDASRTKAMLRGTPPFFHEGPLLRKIEDFRGEVERPMPPIETATGREASRLIRLVTSALAVRHRALYPIEYPNPADVLLAEPGRGYRIVLFGMLPEYRLPLESDYGALLLKNGCPIGYGVGALLFDQMEIAVNVFDTWRGGEAAYLFAQFVRAFRSHFGCRRFKIVRYQIGNENDEGLRSGSFWFYYKLGFLPDDPGTRALAEKEAAKIRRNPRYRTPIATLKLLAESDLSRSLVENGRTPRDDFPLADLGMRTTAWIAENFDGDRALALRETAARAAELLECPEWKRWRRPEREWFRRLSVTVCQIAGIERWPLEERKGLAALMRAKGRASEVEFARRMVGAENLRAALDRLARTAVLPR